MREVTKVVPQPMLLKFQPRNCCERIMLIFSVSTIEEHKNRIG